MEKFIPGTNPEWGRKLPKEDLNSLVDKNGHNYDDGFNFDERDDEVDDGFEELVKERELMEKTRKKTFYAGIFVDKDELYGKAEPTLKNTVENPHVTTNFKPDETQLHIDSLGSEAKIFAIGYGDNGKNQGLLVRVEADDPAIQEAIDKLEKPHITLSYSDDSHPKDTVDLDFEPIEEQFEIDGDYGLFMNGGKIMHERSKLESYIEDSEKSQD